MSDEVSPSAAPSASISSPSIASPPLASSSISEPTTPSLSDAAPAHTSTVRGVGFLDRLDEIQEVEELNVFRRQPLRVALEESDALDEDERGEEVPSGAAVVARHDKPQEASGAGDIDAEARTDGGDTDESFRRWTEAMRKRSPSVSTHLAPTKQNLEARSYQVSLFERAKVDNIVACLPTGAGKTLVSVKLLEHIAKVERQRVASFMDTSPEDAPGAPQPRKRVSLFLVNLVPLVHQQAEAIDANSTLTVAKLFGQLDIDTWSEAQWQSMIREGRYDVIVSTAQIVLDGLNRAFLKMRDVNLIVFDEAHHVSHSDPYARIMKSYHLAPPEERPRIFGMTASPLKSGETFEAAAAHLEATLHATLFTAPESSWDELAQAVAKPRELVIEYDPPRHDLAIEASQLTVLIANECKQYEGIESVLARVEYTSEQHGTLMADLVWYSTAHELHHRARQADSIKQMTDPELQLLKSDWRQAREFGSLLPRSTETREDHALRLTATAKVHRAVADVLKDVKLPDKLEVTPFNASPKMLTLLNTLRCFSRSAEIRRDFCGIIFVNRRQTALALVELVKRMDEFRHFLTPEYLVGHGAGGASGMHWKEQQMTLARFRRGDTNLLIATSVLEEGIDVSPCNLILRFDIFRHHISYVQSRGRARHRNSHFLIMVERRNESEQRTLAKVLRNAQRMSEWIKSLPEDKKAGEFELDLGLDAVDDDDDGEWADEIASLDLGSGDDEEPEADVTSFYQVPATGAMLYPVDSVPLIWYYTITLASEPQHIAAPSFQVVQENKLFQVTLKLPANSKLRSKTGPWCKTKKAAKRMVAFEACKDLHQLGGITDHLVPHRRPKPAAELPQKSSKLRKRDVEVTYEGKRADALARLPASWPAQVFGTQLRCSALVDDDVERRDLLIITSGAVPHIAPFDLYFNTALGHDTKKRFPGVPSSFPVTLTSEQAEHCLVFTERLVRWIGRKAWTCRADDMPYFVVPLKSGVGEATSFDDVCWEEVVRGGAGARETVPLSTSGLFDPADPSSDVPPGLVDRILTEHSYALGASAYSVDAVRHDLSPWSPVPPDSPMREAKYGSFFAYLRDLTHRNKKLPDDVPMQPMLAVTKMGRMVNYSSPREHRIAKKLTEANFLIPQFLFVHCFSASVMRAALLFPTLHARIEQRCLAAELDEELFQGRLGESLVDALTTPSSENVVDYQRFEFIGDTWLKFVATLWVFSCCDTWDQSDLHDARRDLVCNAALLKRALAMRLSRFMTSTGFTTLDWKPKGFIDPPKHLPRTLQPRGAKAHPINLVKRGLRPEDIVQDADETPQDSDVVKHIVGEKTLADIVEAILGAATEKGGVELGLFAFRQMGLLPQPVEDLAEFNDILSRQVQPKAAEGRWGERVSLDALRKLEEHIGYSFKQPHVALEALTHPALLASALPSYERLEFLGDAVLDYFVVGYLKDRFPELDEGRLTTLKGNAVSNAALAALDEVLGIHRYLHHASNELGKAINTFIAEAREARERSAEGKEDVGLYWMGLSAPKVIADVVESILGAVFVDAGFDLAPARDVFERMYLPFMAKHCKPEHSVIISVGDLRAMIEELGCLKWTLEVTEVILPLPPVTGIQSLKASSAHKAAKEFIAQIHFHGRLMASKTTRTTATAAQMAACREILDRVAKEGFDKAVEAVCDCGRVGKEGAGQVGLIEARRKRRGMSAVVVDDEEDVSQDEEEGVSDGMLDEEMGAQQQEEDKEGEEQPSADSGDARADEEMRAPEEE